LPTAKLNASSSVNFRAVCRLPPALQHRARLKLEVLDAAEGLDDLRIPPSNHREGLTGDRIGQHSIRINRATHQ
jgi:plasmid maintenance system killer protein